MQYNKMSCVLKNAYAWSGLSVFEDSYSELRFLEHPQIKEYNWFGAKITFSTHLNNWSVSCPSDEETQIIQRLNIEIKMDEKKGLEEFVSIRNKIISLISFAIKNNVNIENEYLINYNDSYTVTKNHVDYYKFYLMTSETQLENFNTHSWDYNFMLEQLPEDKDINAELDKLSPIFNLYLSLFKYRDMPYEMVFLNIIQALETFHSRFFYKDKKEKYVQSVIDRFGSSPSFEKFKKLLLSDTQMDTNCKYIILVSRLNDLLIGKYDGLFYEYYLKTENYAQTLADTRHYYTHYGKAKEAKALKNDNLLEAIYIMRVLLEYHICLVLGIDNRKKIAEELRNHDDWKKLGEIQSPNRGFTNITYFPIVDKKYLTPICNFDASTINEAINKVKDHSYLEHEGIKGLWILCGKYDTSTDWICIEVGSSNDIKKEIKYDLNLMLSIPDTIDKGSTFHPEKNLFTFPTYSDRTSCKYRAIAGMFKQFQWFEVDTDEYLTFQENIGDYNKFNTLTSEPFDKIEFTEVKIAYDTKALFWNPSPTTHENREKEILSFFQSKSNQQ